MKNHMNLQKRQSTQFNTDRIPVIHSQSAPKKKQKTFLETTHLSHSQTQDSVFFPISLFMLLIFFLYNLQKKNSENKKIKIKINKI